MPNTAPQDNHAFMRTGFIYVLIAACLFSIKAVLVKLAYQYEIQPVVLLTLRMAFSLPIYLLVLLRLSYTQKNSNKQRYDNRLILKVIVLGLCSYYFASILDLAGLQYINANLERLIVYLYPTFVIILSVLFKGQRINLASILCMVIAYIGILLIFNTDIKLAKEQATIVILNMEMSSMVFGCLLTLAGAIFFAVYVTFSENVIIKIGSIRFTCYAMLVASVAIILHFLVTHNMHDLKLATGAYVLIIAIALFSTVIPSFLLSEGIKRIGSAKAGIIGTIGPVVTLITAYFILNEPITLQHVIGMSIVITAIIILSRVKNA